MDLPGEQPLSCCMQWRGPIMGVIGIVFLIAGAVCVGLTGQSPALFWVGIAFIVFAVVHFCVCCGTLLNPQYGGSTVHVHNHFGREDSKQLLPTNDVPLRPSTPSVRGSKMELW
jgi:hypothetical protein